MRKRFEIQYEIGVTPINRVKFPERSRDELPSVLRALQHIYTTPALNEAIFKLLESRIGRSPTGRPGMSFWELLVLGVVRLTLDIDYDRLEHVANYDTLVRGILGVYKFGFDGKRYPIQTIKDNVSLFTEEMLIEINELIVTAGHKLIKKKDEELEVKVDTYVVESNVHFPTDLNLLWDAGRKCIDYVEFIISGSDTCGWRKFKDWKRRINSAYKYSVKQSKSGGRNREERLQEAVEPYLQLARELSQKLKVTKSELTLAACRSKVKIATLVLLNRFEKLLDKHIDLVHRRIILGEKIPHKEKMFSLFEPYTEWINKGKGGNRVELGLNVAICTDQYGFILHHRVLEKEHDVDVAVPIADYLLERRNTRSISFDKGFWSKENFENLTHKVIDLIMPKKGKRNKNEYIREHSKQFRSLRKKHSVIESDINCLEHHGLNRCPDKGMKHFRKYVALGIISFNLHRLGNVLLKNDRKNSTKQKLKAA